GHWVAMHTEVDRLALPSMIERIRFFGPHPSPGDRFDCTVRVNELTDAFVRADLELVSARPADAGRLWCRIDGWQDTRFDTDEVVFPVLRDPDRLVVAERRPGGWFLATEHWDNSASRELMMRRYLNHRERPTYEALNPKAQRQWFLGRVAAKDAVRSWLWDHGAGPLFPAEITIGNDDEGRPVVEGPGCDGLRVSLAHTEWAAAAVVAGPGEPDPGIDVEADGPRHERFASLTLADAERSLVPAGEGPERDGALTRLWTVKEAAGKAAGTGLEGRPKDLVVTELDETTARLADRTVATEVVAVGEGDTARRYVVSWTTT
ncbi:MAG TPA: 4'-phosphopantetheinyl transferase superfamily protein, partial [Acidimicrobiales bacterium]|nr:4'-phosphopantetheinyl transferase superfamily protein [Acidimicrobiales bacterium]